ncbi:hypothetical protein DSECCO2_632420 [anaerobic digester metagenome]
MRPQHAIRRHPPIVHQGQVAQFAAGQAHGLLQRKAHDRSFGRGVHARQAVQGRQPRRAQPAFAPGVAAFGDVRGNDGELAFTHPVDGHLQPLAHVSGIAFRVQRLAGQGHPAQRRDP